MKLMSIFSILASLLFSFASLANAQLNFYFLNVGQGDAIYIELPNGSNALIDGGPTQRLIENFLRSKHISHIDHVLLTHPHSDHYIGLKKVFNMASVNNFYDSRAENVSARGDNTLREQANAQPNCKTHFPALGEYLNWDKDVSIRVLNTCNKQVLLKRNSDINNCSIVLRIAYKGKSIILMGDAEVPVEQMIMKTFGKEEIKSYAIKLGHHGSDTSSSKEFIKAVKPEIAIIQVGQNNKYGHPSYSTLQTLKELKIKTYTTQNQMQTLTFPAVIKGADIGMPFVDNYEVLNQPVQLKIPMINNSSSENKVLRTLDKLNKGNTANAEILSF